MGLAESMSKSIGKYQRKDALKKKQKGRKTTKSPESILQDAIIRHFLDKGFMVIRHNSFMQFSEQSGTPMRAYILSNTGGSAGLADVSVGKDGKLVYIEVKTGYNKQSEPQKKFEGVCNKFNMPYCVAYSVEQAEEKVNQIFNN
ncbi:MAG: hypothetical protein WC121_14160 [Candidatus Kapaibacterium sp.]